MSESFDYIIVGGGTAGVVLASRLSHNRSVALVEAGPDAHQDPLVSTPLNAPRLHNTPLEWNYQTKPQSSLGGRQIYQAGGKLLSGSSGVNYGLWTRGHSRDFDELANDVGHDRWGYQQLLPYFKRTETHFTGKEEARNPEAHGYDGPIHTCLPAEYPMREIMRNAYSQAGFDFNEDGNSGDPFGVALWTSNWKDLQRQPAAKAYDLSKVHVITSTLVHKVNIARTGPTAKATGVLLSNGNSLSATKEVIVSCGSLRTPQVLMLSGVGPTSHLSSHGIETIVDSPDVGRNLHDHAMVMLFWKLKHPEKGLAMGAPNFPPPKVGPAEWVYTGSVDSGKLAKALSADGFKDASSHPHTRQRRAHFEMTCRYGAVGAPPGMLPQDGSIIGTGAACLLGTSRGSVELSSTDPAADPVIDPNYLSTEHDLCIVREAIRTVMRVMDTEAGKAEVEGLFIPPGTDPISAKSTDEELNEYIKKWSITFFHTAGTAALGSVLDEECRVKGVDRLRVVDASVLPRPIAAHLQAPVYAIAEMMSDVILKK